MLIEPESNLYSYAITRDFGFAPNPFHGVCTLATCKPGIRKSARIGDWVLGIGGSALGPVYRKCILLMKVTQKTTFQDYWDNPEFNLKKPVRNGSRVQMLGDNIYHKAPNGDWIQEDSHHSNADGTYNINNMTRDTSQTDSVLISDLFLYFGESAIPINLDSIRYGRVRNYIKTQITSGSVAKTLIEETYSTHKSKLNTVISDPCQFNIANKRVDQKTGKLS